MNAFRAAEGTWRDRLRMLPNTVRQTLVTRQLAAHLPDAPAKVLDVGCGQGTQALRLAERGYDVTGVDKSDGMLADFESALAERPEDVRRRVHLRHGDVEHLADVVTAHGPFDVVLCHGVLMYLPDPVPALVAMRGAVAPNGVLSLLVRNADVGAFHAGLRGDWLAASVAFGSVTYTNRLGVEARADRIDDLLAKLDALGMSARQWYGVLTFAEFAAMESPVPESDEFERIMACEEKAGQIDPYRRVSAMFHLIASHA